MALEVAVYQSNRRRSREICEAMAEGIAKIGDCPIVIDETTYRTPDFKIAVFYGLAGNLKRAFDEYKVGGRKVVFIDLGFWDRRLKNKNRYEGYHKISINDRHPTTYFQNRAHAADRIARFNLTVQPWRTSGRYILLAGMSAKSSWVEGFAAEEWERSAVKQLAAVTDRPIIYRPKPSCPNARPIKGTRWSPREEELESLLKDCHAVVTHHSNVAVEGLTAGVPAFCWDGVAKPMSLQEFGKIDQPLHPEGREQWLADIAYAQWNLEEMREGLPWRHLKDEGLVLS